MDVSFYRVQVHRGGSVAVRDATGAFRHQKWTGLIGANGSGKTSLLRAVAGRLPIVSGRVEMGGQDRTGERIWRAASIGFAPDVSALPPGLTGREYLGLVRRRADSSASDRHLAELRAALGVDSLIDRRIATLSHGMRQRIAIFSAFADLAETVILDEPFNWLDPVCAFETKEALRRLVAGRHLTLVTALHEISTLTVYCDGGLLMGDGVVVRRLGGEELRKGAGDIATFESSIIDDFRSGGRE